MMISIGSATSATGGDSFLDDAVLIQVVLMLIAVEDRFDNDLRRGATGGKSFRHR